MGCNGSKSTDYNAQGGKQNGKGGSDKKAVKGDSSTASKPQAANPDRPILGRYKMFTNKEDVMGKGTSSICRKGKDMVTGKSVAIKVYKEQSSGGKVKETTMQKYKRQIAVLKELQEDFKIPADKTLWHQQLENVKPTQLFMQLLDYSKDKEGEPAPDPNDGMLYVVTELAQYSLKDFLADRREKQKPLSKEAVRDLSKRIMLAMAGLHAKGFVHVDMKPENMMVFDGRLKVIDVDGCVSMGTKVSINDGSISFSPCYCAPEWARFMIKDNEQSIVAQPGLDVWSVGMTLCEFVTLDAIWKPQYANFMRNAQSHREAGFLFLEWLSEIKKAPLPKSVEKFDPGLLDLLHNWLLVCDLKKRKSCAQALSNPYLAEGGWEKYGDQNKPAVEAAPATRVKRDRQEDDSTLAPLHKGTLWKLNTGSNAKDPASWIKRDMWLAHNHSLCYYSVKENKRLVLIDGEKLSEAQVTLVPGVAKECAFEISSKPDAEERMEKIVLAAETAEELEKWQEKLGKAGNMDMIVTFQLGAKMAEDLQAFRLAVRNRRMKVEGDKEAFAPMFKAKLWKLKTGGDRAKPEDWFMRDMWIAKNGSLVYFSPKEERDLVYYTAKDIANCKITRIADGEAHLSHVFQIHLPPENGVEFDPGEFAAESAALRDQWIEELGKCM